MIIVKRALCGPLRRCHKTTHIVAVGNDYETIPNSMRCISLPETVVIMKACLI